MQLAIFLLRLRKEYSGIEVPYPANAHPPPTTDHPDMYKKVPLRVDDSGLSTDQWPQWTKERQEPVPEIYRCQLDAPTMFGPELPPWEKKPES